MVDRYNAGLDDGEAPRDAKVSDDDTRIWREEVDERLGALAEQLRTQGEEIHSLLFQSISEAERKGFIREAAMRMAATHAGWAPTTYWALARELWAARPEDC